MANELTIAKTGGFPTKSQADIQRAKARAAELTQGISSPFGRVTIKQGKWGINYQGVGTPLVRWKQQANGQWMNDGAEPFLDCVILDAAERTAKVWYADAYDGSSRKPPDCFSSNGIKPDAAATKKQNDFCATCPQNGWGTAKRADGSASRGKACSDQKHLAVVPVNDIPNQNYGGPMLLSVPPSSLKRWKEYVDALANIGFVPHEVWTRISFEDNPQGFPFFAFDCPTTLTIQQTNAVDQMRKHPLVPRIINSEVKEATGWDDGAEAPPTQTAPAAGSGGAELPDDTGDGNPAASPPPGVTPEEWAAIQAMRKPVEEKKPTPPPGPPPGVTPEEWAAIQQMRNGSSTASTAAAPSPSAAVEDEVKPRKNAKRTAAVSPQPHDSASVPAQSAAPSQSADPAPVTANGNGADPDAIATKITAMVDKLV